MRTSAFFVEKNLGFFENYSVSARTREERLSQCGHAADEGVNFSPICADALYGRPLTFFSLFGSNIVTRLKAHLYDIMPSD